LGAYFTLFLTQFIGILALGFYLLHTGQLQFLVGHTSWVTWMWAVLAALLNVASLLALYRAFELGKLVFVSPIAGSYAAVTVVLAFLIGEALTRTHDVALGLVFLGILGAATPFMRMRVDGDGGVAQSGEDEARETLVVPIERVRVNVWRN